jgi:hypothetical protein
VYVLCTKKRQTENSQLVASRAQQHHGRTLHVY